VDSGVRVRINARDVAVALTRPENISVQNVFAGVITEISGDTGDMVDILLDIGHPLLARVTPRARLELDLRPGRPIYALIKSVSISHGCCTSSENGSNVSPGQNKKRAIIPR
jgi:molybdate transport system ATP-binding protein